MRGVKADSGVKTERSEKTPINHNRLLSDCLMDMKEIKSEHS